MFLVPFNRKYIKKLDSPIAVLRFSLCMDFSTDGIWAGCVWELGWAQHVSYSLHHLQQISADRYWDTFGKENHLSKPLFLEGILCYFSRVEEFSGILWHVRRSSIERLRVKTSFYISHTNASRSFQTSSSSNKKRFKHRNFLALDLHQAFRFA